MPFVSREFEAQWKPLVTTTVHGVEVRVMHHPEQFRGPVLLMTHGLEEFWQAWLPMAEIMFDEFRILSVDAPWRAQNDYQWSEVGTPSQWLAEVVDLLPVPPDVLVGHSFGSNTTLEYLATPFAAPVRAAVLTAPVYRAKREEISWDLLHGSLANFRDILSAGLAVRNGSRVIPPDVFEKMIDVLVERVGPNGFINLFRLFGHAPFIPLEKITVPTLVIAGETEQTDTGTGTQALAANLPRGRLAQLAEYNHFCEITQAAECAALTSGFLKEHVPWFWPARPPVATAPVWAPARTPGRAG